MEANAINPFHNGSSWLRADFHLHTKSDKEFSYDGDENSFIAEYVERLKIAKIGIGVITNHNKFNIDEFKALRRRARKEGIGVLPGVELSVNDGANGVLGHHATFFFPFLLFFRGPLLFFWPSFSLRELHAR
jgi:chromosome segregation protein